MEGRFKIELRAGLDSYKDFVEICERRNLFTHTGGVVSRQYIDVCLSNKIDVTHAVIGKTVEATPEYYKNAVEIFYEIGVKLCYTLWRKFEPNKCDVADQVINDTCFSLIVRRQYRIAEKILTHVCGVMKRYRGADDVRRMMIVNLANSLRLQGRKKQARDVINEEDWRATSLQYQICVDAINENMVEMIKKMKAGGTSAISANDYRSWPVFRQIRTRTEFVAAFKEIFGFDLFQKKEQDLLDGIEVADVIASSAKH